ncbi:hypothetical protein COV93_06235 [Candidatus Woesearchaeota archaeon CG11_big_fil_rev_8_21_14_0_20_43_8]|nr:MAG: hypothetical protein COV93_06235 [Candidatus Woesearchaeota archaeon CG11_big_fil_rev_8_21_14_0_20_43_8]
MKRRKFHRKFPLVIGHRGAGVHGFDNSIGSFKKAINLHADMIELDVRMTKDKKIIVIHDSKIDNNTDGKGKVKDLTLCSIRKHKLKDGQDIPTLDEVLTSVGKKIILNIEIKAEGLERRLVHLLRKHDVLDYVIVSSFYQQALLKVKRMEPGIRTALLMFRFNLKNVLVAKKLHCFAVHPRSAKIHELLIDLAHIMGMKVYPWTIDKPKDMRILLRKDVDGIITDKIDVLHKVLHSRNKKKLSFFRKLFKKHI